MKKISFVNIMAFTLANVIGYSQQVKADNHNPPSPTNAPETRRPIGDRPYCPLTASGVTLTPLIPEHSSHGYTTIETPTVWVNIAYENSSPNQLSGELSLLDKNGDLVTERIIIDLPDVSSTFPIILPNLPEVDRHYSWILEINCGDDNYFDVTGYISWKKTINDLTHANPQERVTTYLNEDIWYDALNESVNLYCQYPSYLRKLLTRENLLSIEESFNCQDR